MERVTLRTVGRSLYFRMPARFVHMFNLSDGDEFLIVQGKNNATFNITKEKLVADALSDIVDKAVGKELEAAE